MSRKKKSKPPATALQHQSLCQAVATHEAATCQSIWVESSTVLFTGTAVQASTKLFQNVNLRQTLQDFLREFSETLQFLATSGALSCTNRRCQRTCPPFSSSGPQKGKGRLPIPYISRNERKRTEMAKLPLPLFARSKHGRLDSAMVLATFSQ